MNKYKIDIEGLPEGWEVDKATFLQGSLDCYGNATVQVRLKKSKPRRIVAPDGITDPSGLWVTKDNTWILKGE